jgi:hypothetical protein
MKLSPRDIVLRALEQGKERTARYSHLGPDGVVVHGRVAVVKRNGVFSVGWHEIREDTESFDEPDSEGLEDFPTAEEVEAFITNRFALRLEALAPARGIRFF